MNNSLFLTKPSVNNNKRKPVPKVLSLTIPDFKWNISHDMKHVLRPGS